VPHKVVESSPQKPDCNRHEHGWCVSFIPRLTIDGERVEQIYSVLWHVVHPQYASVRGRLLVFIGSYISYTKCALRMSLEFTRSSGLRSKSQIAIRHEHGPGRPALGRTLVWVGLHNCCDWTYASCFFFLKYSKVVFFLLNDRNVDLCRNA
jgi:hypothetical protein